MSIEFPEGFPDVDQMFGILHKTIEKSWKTEIDISKIELWLNNFSGEVFDQSDEQRLALWLLCNYTYYSSEDMNHLCKTLYNKFIHQFIIENCIPIDKLADKMSTVCFSSMGSASESGGLILYHFRQEARLPIDQFFYPTNIPYNDETIIVFIDDALLSGGTGARNYYDYLKDKEYKKVYYLAIVASEGAVNKLADKGINVIYCALLDERNKTFSENSMVFHRYPTLKTYARDISKKYGERIAPENVQPLGYKNGEYCFGFYYNTPNNTLPIFWSDINWNPIFTRREKLQNARNVQPFKNRYI